MANRRAGCSKIGWGGVKGQDNRPVAAVLWPPQREGSRAAWYDLRQERKSPVLMRLRNWQKSRHGCIECWFIHKNSSDLIYGNDFE